jgi:hypothetical protein
VTWWRQADWADYSALSTDPSVARLTMTAAANSLDGPISLDTATEALAEAISTPEVVYSFSRADDEPSYSIWAADAIEVFEDTARTLVSKGVPGVVAVDRARLVFGVPEVDHEYIKAASNLSLLRSDLVNVADETLARFLAPYALDTVVKDDDFDENEVNRDAKGRFAPEGGSRNAGPQIDGYTEDGVAYRIINGNMYAVDVATANATAEEKPKAQEEAKAKDTDAAILTYAAKQARADRINRILRVQGAQKKQQAQIAAAAKAEAARKAAEKARAKAAADAAATTASQVGNQTARASTGATERLRAHANLDIDALRKIVAGREMKAELEALARGPSGPPPEPTRGLPPLDEESWLEFGIEFSSLMNTFNSVRRMGYLGPGEEATIELSGRDVKDAIRTLPGPLNDPHGNPGFRPLLQDGDHRLVNGAALLNDIMEYANQATPLNFNVLNSSDLMRYEDEIRRRSIVAIGNAATNSDVVVDVQTAYEPDKPPQIELVAVPAQDVINAAARFAMLRASQDQQRPSTLFMEGTFLEPVHSEALGARTLSGPTTTIEVVSTDNQPVGLAYEFLISKSDAVAEAWDESQVERDLAGRFAREGGALTAVAAPSLDAAKRAERAYRIRRVQAIQSKQKAQRAVALPAAGTQSTPVAAQAVAQQTAPKKQAAVENLRAHVTHDVAALQAEAQARREATQAKQATAPSTASLSATATTAAEAVATAPARASAVSSRVATTNASAKATATAQATSAASAVGNANAAVRKKPKAQAVPELITVIGDNGPLYRAMQKERIRLGQGESADTRSVIVPPDALRKVKYAVYAKRDEGFVPDSHNSVHFTPSSVHRLESARMRWTSKGDEIRFDLDGSGTVDDPFDVGPIRVPHQDEPGTGRSGVTILKSAGKRLAPRRR